MKRFEVLVIGGGPAGSTCAKTLHAAGVDVAIVDRARFPREKPCAGWITPEVIDAVQLDCDEYRRGRTLQPFTGFRVAAMHGKATTVRFARPVSYGICRTEFDDYLVRRAGAPLIEGYAVRDIRPAARGWIVNEEIETPLIVGAAGYFCPVARALGFTPPSERAVVAQETEIVLSPAEARACRVDGETPQLFFCDDLGGYGWAIRKGDRLNVGLGRRDHHGLSAHLEAFLAALDPAVAAQARGGHWRGHAYLLRDEAQRPLSGDGFLLIGDAAGLAYATSGEGIRPAVISGLLAAQTILETRGRTSAADLAAYDVRIGRRFPRAAGEGLSSWMPGDTYAAATRKLIGQQWFARHMVVGRRFLRPEKARVA